MSDRLTPQQRHTNMQHIRSKDTKPELILRKELWHAGIRYRKNYGKLPGKPDIAITKYKIAVFCDSEFFHGKDWETSLKEQLQKGNNPDFWIPKIERNLIRDLQNEKDIKALGWSIIRFWGRDIIKHPQQCVTAVKEAIFEKKTEGIETNVQID